MRYSRGFVVFVSFIPMICLVYVRLGSLARMQQAEPALLLPVEGAVPQAPVQEEPQAQPHSVEPQASVEAKLEAQPQAIEPQAQPQAIELEAQPQAIEPEAQPQSVEPQAIEPEAQPQGVEPQATEPEAQPPSVEPQTPVEIGTQARRAGWHCDSVDGNWRTRMCSAFHVCNTGEYTIIDTDSVVESAPPAPFAPGLGRCDDTDPRHELKIGLARGVPRPLGAKWVPGPTIFLRRYCPGNFGHFLLDALFPAFVNYFALYPDGPGPNILVDDLCSDGASLFEYSESDCENMTARLLPALSDHIHFVRSSSSNTCFEEVISSNCKYGLFSSYGGLGAAPVSAFRQFRALVWRRAGVTFERTTTTRMALVTFKKPGRRRRYTNAPEVTEWLQEALVGAEVVLKDLGEASFSESIQWISKVFLFVTPAGATSMSSMFMSPGSTVITGTFCNDCALEACNNHDTGFYFAHLHKLDIQYHQYPVRHEDLVFPRTAQGCDYRMGNREWLVATSLAAAS